jgi:8-oxo-dGTP pyrophosphatase MutT (NUDIX family)
MDERVTSPTPNPREAAAVILIRKRTDTGEAEVFLLRRHSGSSFMARSFVFPGGAVDPEDGDHREAAVRELFEEAGVLLAEGPVPANLTRWRKELHEGTSFSSLVESAGLRLTTDALHHFAHWITPSFEAKRFSARFFVAELPPGQVPSFDNVETVDEVWVTPEEALARAGELRLPPPQLRTMYDLRDAAAHGPAAVLTLARERARNPHPIVPRAIDTPSAPGGLTLLLPWDPEYATASGDGIEMPKDHPLAHGPSRFIVGDDRWHLVRADC